MEKVVFWYGSQYLKVLQDPKMIPLMDDIVIIYYIIESTH